MFLKIPQHRAYGLLAIVLLASCFQASARENLLVDTIPEGMQLRDVSGTVTDILARNRWRVLPGSAQRIQAQYRDPRTVCRASVLLRATALFLVDDCRKPDLAGNWQEDGERRAIPEAWLRPLRRELRLRYPRPTPVPQAPY